MAAIQLSGPGQQGSKPEGGTASEPRVTALPISGKIFISTMTCANHPRNRAIKTYRLLIIDELATCQ